MVSFSVRKRSYYNLRSVRENEDKTYMGYEMLKYSMSVMDNMFSKEICYNIHHNEIDFDQNKEDRYERSGYENISNEGLNKSENEICI